ncbi:MAG: ATP-binding cassette domain-containing protein [Planctomycetota bacterium]
MANVQLERVAKVYPGGVRAVHGVDLEIADGEFLVLVGPSGCGKSTTLRMIAGLEEISEGTLSIDGAVVNEVPPRDRDIAMVFQNYALYPHMTVRENLAFGLKRRRVHGSPLKRLTSSTYRDAARREDQSIAERVAAAAETLGIDHLLDRRPAALSGGQRQRVAVGRALVRDPKVFLFDEPLSNLDAKLRMETRTELKALHRQTGSTMVYVTHDQEEAMTLGDRLVVMREGLVQQCADPVTIYERPANRFVAGFVGTPTMNLIEGRLEDGRFVSDALEVDLPSRRPLGTRPAVLGLRPDRLVPTDDGPIEAGLRVLEHLGDRVDLALEAADGSRLVARAEVGAVLDSGGQLPREGSRMRFRAAEADAHLFAVDGDGERL